LSPPWRSSAAVLAAAEVTVPYSEALGRNVIIPSRDDDESTVQEFAPPPFLQNDRSVQPVATLVSRTEEPRADKALTREEAIEVGFGAYLGADEHGDTLISDECWVPPTTLWLRGAPAVAVGASVEPSNLPHKRKENGNRETSITFEKGGGAAPQPIRYRGGPASVSVLPLCLRSDTRTAATSAFGLASAALSRRG
jgi:hypothetical protein